MKRLRMNENLTQKEMAVKLGIGVRTYQRIEAGVQMPNCEVVIRLQKLFEENIDTILTPINVILTEEKRKGKLYV